MLGRKSKEENKILEYILMKPVIKISLLSISTIIIGILSSYVVTGNFNNIHKFSIFSLFLISIFYIFIMIYYATKETNIHKMNHELNSQNEAFSEAMSSLTARLKTDSSIINNYAKYFEGIKTYQDINKFDFNAISCSLCETIYNVICKFSKQGKGFLVSYLKTIEYNEVGEVIKVKMIAYNLKQDQPSTYGVEISIDYKNTQNCNLELFKTRDPQPLVLPDSKSVHEHFIHKKNEYAQYIGIPVFCDENKMDGLLQISVLKKSIIKENIVDLEFITSNFLLPYSSLFLHLSKIDKMLKAKRAYNEVKNNEQQSNKKQKNNIKK